MCKHDSIIRDSAHWSCCGSRSKVGVCEKTGATHRSTGTGPYWDKLYCGRHIGREKLPHSDGVCGPDDGPQCVDCIAQQRAWGSGVLELMTRARPAGVDGMPDSDSILSALAALSSLDPDSPTQSFAVGDEVVLSPQYSACSDADEGPLSIGEVGVVVTVSGRILVAKRQVGGSEPGPGIQWWYDTAALTRHPSPSAGDTESGGSSRPNHILKHYSSGHVMCGTCGMYGPSTQTGSEECERCKLCATCCGKQPSCTIATGSTASGRPSIGDVVMLAPGYESCLDAAHGPLSVGEAGLIVKVDSSSKPFKVAAKGRKWWYTAAALQVAPPGTPRSPTVGDSVVLAPGFEAHSDAAGGPLKVGDVGKIVKDDGSSKPFHVEANGRTWWYAAAAVQARSPRRRRRFFTNRSGRPARPCWSASSGAARIS